MDTAKDIVSLRAVRQSETNAGDQFIKQLFDEGTFAELGTYISSSAGGLEPVICGYGALEGNLVYSFVEVSARDRGAFGSASAKKICNIIETAKKNNKPLIAVFDSAGARITEGLYVTQAYGSVMSAVAKAEHIIPRIAVINGICSGGAAVIAGMFDIIISVGESSEIYINPPFVTGEAKKSDIIDIFAADMTECSDIIRRLLKFLSPAEYFNNDNLNRKTPELEEIIKSKYNINDILNVLAGNEGFIELYAKTNPEMFCGFINIGNMAAGIVANNPVYKNGDFTIDGAQKAQKIISLCGAFDIPLLTLLNTAGYEYSSQTEKFSYNLPYSNLAAAYAKSNNPKVTVILGKAYGTAPVVLGSSAVGADLVYAVIDSDISSMPPESIVQFLYNDKIKTSIDPAAEREKLVFEYKTEKSSPAAAAQCGIIDDVIEYAELRQRIISAFEMLCGDRY